MASSEKKQKPRGKIPDRKSWACFAWISLPTIKTGAEHYVPRIQTKQAIAIVRAASSPTREIQQARKPKHIPPPDYIEGKEGTVYYFGNQISAGGYSRCYVVKNQYGREYAAKTISRSAITSVSVLRQIEREASIHRELKHPAIVNFLQLIEGSSHVCLVLDYCPNNTLNDYLSSRGRCTETETCQLMKSIFDATHYLHKKLIHHGDLKLSNIFLDNRMCPKIGDFGFSKQFKIAEQQRRSLCGTPAYMAPEIINKPCQFGLPSDIWSLGIITYALIYGVTAFDASNIDAVYARIRSYDLNFPDIVPTVSDEAIESISWMLYPDPDLRPTSRMLTRSGWIKRNIRLFKINELPSSPNLNSTFYGSERPKSLRSRLKLITADKTEHLKSAISSRLKPLNLPSMAR